MIWNIKFILAKVPFSKKIWKRLKYYLLPNKKSDCFLQHGSEVFRKTCEVLNKEGIQYWPEFGTLLGIVRDNAFIKHDFDFDFGVYVQDLNRVKELLLANGFSLLYHYHGVNRPDIQELTFVYNGVHVDFFGFNTIDENSIACYVFESLYKPQKQPLYKIRPIVFPPFKLVKSSFSNVSIMLPEDTTTHLTVSYGKNFMTPDPFFESLHKTALKDTYAYCEKQQV